MSSTVKAVTAFLGLAACTIVLCTDCYLPNGAAVSDFVSSFYASGHLVATGRASDLYPAANAENFDKAPYNQVAHELIRDLPKNRIAAYLDPPLIALFFAPFSLLPPAWALLTFQLISLACLALTTENVLAAVLKKEMGRADVLNWTFSSICFLPILFTLWVGQIGILLGTLPLSLGFRYLLTKKPIRAGLVLSLCILKPQFSLLALFLAASPIVERKNKCLIAMGFGVFGLLLLNLIIFGPNVLGAWFNCLELSAQIFSVAPAFNIQIATSLPQAVILILPKDFVAICRPSIYIVGAFIGLLGFVTSLRLMQAKIKDENKFAAALILAAFATPLTMPQFFLYDFSCLYPAALAVTFTKWHPERRWYFQSLLRLAWFAINIYTLTLFFHREFAEPLVLLAFMLAFFRRLLMIIEEVREKDAIKSVPMATY